MNDLLFNIVFTVTSLYFVVDYKQLGEDSIKWKKKYFSEFFEPGEDYIKPSQYAFLIFGVTFLATGILTLIGFIKFNKGAPSTGIVAIFLNILCILGIIYAFYKIYQSITRKVKNLLKS